MSLNYSIAMLRNPQKPDEDAKAYAKSQITRDLTLKELSRRVAGQTTASRADVSAVIISTVENMIEGLRAGEQVDFGDLGNSDFKSQVVQQIRRKNLLLRISPESTFNLFLEKT